MQTVTRLSRLVNAVTVISALCLGGVSALAASKASVRVLVPSTPMHAVEGIAFDAEGRLYGTSIHGQRVYRIDTATGAVSIAVDSPDGESDDVAIGPPGTPAAGILAWTAQRSGEIRIQRPGGRPEVLLRGVPRVNPIAFNAQGRLFTAQAGADGDPLWELDPVGGKAPRLVFKDRGQLNGFAFGPDGRLYAPQFRSDKLLAIDVESGTIETIAQQVGAPAAVKVDRDGVVWSVDYLTGDVWRTSAEQHGARTAHIVASLPAPLDSLAIAADGTIYVSAAADRGIVALDLKQGRHRTVVPGGFTMPLGIAMTQQDGREQLLVADPFGYRFVDTENGRITRPPWAGNRGASSAIAVTDSRIAWGWVSGKRLRSLERAGDALQLDSTAIAAPRGLLLEDAGSLLVLDAAEGRLLRVDATGSTTLATGLNEPVGLAWFDADSVLVAERGAGAISRVDLRSGTRRELASGLAAPTGVALMQDGRLAVVEPPLRRVVAVDPKTSMRTPLATGLAVSLDGLDLPANTNAGIAVGRDGAIYVSCPGDNSIVKITPAGRRRK